MGMALGVAGTIAKHIRRQFLHTVRWANRCFLVLKVAFLANDLQNGLSMVDLVGEGDPVPKAEVVEDFMVETQTKWRKQAIVAHRTSTSDNHFCNCSVI